MRMEERYVIDEDGFTGAVARLVEQFTKQNPSIGKFQCTCHDGTVVTIEVEKKKLRAKKWVGDGHSA